MESTFLPHGGCEGGGRGGRAKEGSCQGQGMAKAWTAAFSDGLRGRGTDKRPGSWEEPVPRFSGASTFTWGEGPQVID